MEIWKPKPPGTLWATSGLLQDCFTFYIYIYIYIFIYIYLYLYIHTYINQCNKLVKFEVHPRPGHEGPETEVLYCSSTVTLVLEGKGA